MSSEAWMQCKCRSQLAGLKGPGARQRLKRPWCVIDAEVKQGRMEEEQGRAWRKTSADVLRHHANGREVQDRTQKGDSHHQERAIDLAFDKI